MAQSIEVKQTASQSKLSGWRKRIFSRISNEVGCTNESSKAVLKTQTQNSNLVFANVNQKKQLGDFPIRPLFTGRGRYHRQI
jgi:hypothetical protein